MKIGRSKTNGYFTSSAVIYSDYLGYIYPTTDSVYINDGGFVSVIAGSYPEGSQLRIFGYSLFTTTISPTAGNIVGDFHGVVATYNIPIVLVCDGTGTTWYKLSDFGAIGPTGAIGNVGGTGPTGATGGVGPEGVQGTVGPTGIPGGEGAVGPIGDTGGIGTPGSAGSPGNPGGQGFTGPEGNPGAEGPPGTPC